MKPPTEPVPPTVLLEQVDEWRNLVEEKIGRGRDTGGTSLLGEEFIEPVEERRGDAVPVAVDSLGGGAKMQSG